MILYWLTRCVGYLAELRVPSFLIFVFAKSFGIAIEDAEKPLSNYVSINDFFTRALRSELRPIDHMARIISPVDGEVLISGVIKSGQIFQAKGLSYSLQELVKLPSHVFFDDGYFATFYLSPKDCHRIFSPVSGDIIQACLIGGKLLPLYLYFTPLLQVF